MRHKAGGGVIQQTGIRKERKGGNTMINDQWDDNIHMHNEASGFHSDSREQNLEKRMEGK